MRYTVTAAIMLLAACGAPEGNAADQTIPERTEINELARPPADLETDDAPAENAVTPVDPAPNPATVIPAAFHGRWARNCAKPAETTLTVEPGRVRFYESEGRVTALKAVSPREVEVTGAFAGEGETWNETHRLALSADGKTLTVTTRGTAFERYRCA